MICIYWIEIQFYSFIIWYQKVVTIRLTYEIGKKSIKTGKFLTFFTQKKFDLYEKYVSGVKKKL